jgi:hypothetical protein
MWILVKEDHKTKEATVAGRYGSKYEALEAAENMAKDYAQQRNGDSSPNQIFSADATGRPFAYFVQKSGKINDKLCVKHKFLVSGWVSTSVMVETIFTLMPVRVSKNPIQRLLDDEIRLGKLDGHQGISKIIEKLSKLSMLVKQIVPLDESQAQPQSDHGISESSDDSQNDDPGDYVPPNQVFDDLSDLSE